MALSKYKQYLEVSFMFFKEKKFKYMFGVLLFLTVFITGFVKVNMVYSSTGIGGGNISQELVVSEDVESKDTLSTINDNAFMRIYKEDYGFDIVFRSCGKEKTFVLRLPWKNK